jgi:hypothetical protein
MCFLKIKFGYVLKLSILFSLQNKTQTKHLQTIIQKHAKL